jgi:hypothetical protein
MPPSCGEREATRLSIPRREAAPGPLGLPDERIGREGGVEDRTGGLAA